MLFNNNSQKTPGCLSIGFFVCLDIGYNGKNWSL